MQHSNHSPVIHVFMFNGQPVNIRRRCGGTLDEAAAAFVETMLPQNSAAKQEVNHAIAEDCSCRPVAVVSGNAGCVGSVPCGEAGR